MNPTPDGASEATPGTIKLIGIGQSLRGDDGAGLQAVQLWQAKYQATGLHAEVKVELAELPGTGLLDLLQGARLAILVDAVKSGAQAGRVHILSPDQLGAFTCGAGSAHGFGVAEVLSLGEKLMPSQMPGKMILVGIEAGSFRMGDIISPEVAGALPGVVKLIEELITRELANSKV